MEATDKKETSKKSPSKAKRLLRALLLVVLIAVVSGGVWYWQQMKVDDLSQQNQTLQNDVEQNKNARAELVKQLEVAQNERQNLDEKMSALEEENNRIKNPQQATLALTTGEVKHNKETYNDSGKDLLYIDLAVKNESAVEGYFSPYSLRLKDDDDKIHPLCQDSAVGYYVCQSGLDLPQGKVELKSLAVRPGETVKGTVAFYVPKSLNSYTLSYDGKDLRIN